MRLRVEYSVPSPAVGASSVSVTMRVFVDVRYSISDSNNTFSRSGTFPGSGSGSVSLNVATDGSQQVWSVTKSVPLGTSASSQSFSFSLTGVDYVGSSVSASVSGSVAIPARAVAAPAAPTSVTVSRVSDTRQKVTWAASSTSSAPIARFEIQRWLSTTNTWVTVASQVSASSRSYEVKGSSADMRVNLRVRAVNSAGASAYGTGAAVVTTPLSATGVSATLTGAAAVTLRWTNRSKIASHVNVQQSTRSPGGAWSAWTYVSGATGLSASVQSRALSGLAAGLEYRWRVQTAATPPTLYAHSTASNTISPATPPAAPTLLAPPALSLEGPTGFAWRHNSLDGSVQQSAELEVQAVGGATQAVTVTGSTGSHELDVTVGDYLWRARTRGLHASFGPWSGWSSLRVVAQPVVEITAPVGVSSASRPTVTWTYLDPAGPQVSASMELHDAAGVLLESLEVVGAATQARFVQQLTDGTGYQVWLTVTSATGFSSVPVIAEFTTDFVEPAAPEVALEWDAAVGQVTVRVTNPSVVGLPAAVSNRVERSLDGGTTWVEVLGQVDVDGQVLDTMVPLGRRVDYRAVAVTADGAEQAGPAQAVVTDADVVFLAADDGSLWRLEYNLQIGVESGHDVAIEHYLGDALPTAHHGQARPRRYRLSGLLVSDEGTYSDGAELLGRPLLYRDPEGRLDWVTLTASGVGSSQSWHAVREVSLELEAIRRD